LLKDLVGYQKIFDHVKRAIVDDEEGTIEDYAESEV